MRLRLVLLLLLYSLNFDHSQVYTLPLKNIPSPHYLYRTLNLTLSLLNQTNPALARECWLCLSLSSSAYVAIPTPIEGWNQAKITLAYKKEKGNIFSERADTLLGDYPTVQANQASLLFRTYIQSLAKVASSSLPVTGPIALHTPLLTQAPLCFTRSQGNISMGDLPSSACNTTVKLELPNTYWSQRIDYQVSPEANGHFLQPVRFTSYPTVQAVGFNCSFPSLSLFPWITPHTSIPTHFYCKRVSTSHLSPLIGSAMAATLSVWSAESGQRPPYPATHLFSLHLSACLHNQGIFFLCGQNTYVCLPTNWTGTCTLIYLSPNVDIAPNNQSLPIPVTHHIQYKREVQLIPLLITLGISTGFSTGIGGLATSLSYYQSLSKDLAESLEEIAQSIVAVQDRIDSLAAVTLQNRRGLDLLTAEKGGLCLFLEEECCFYANQSGIVRDGAKKLADRDSKRRQELSESWSSWNIQNWALWVLPLAGPLLMILVVLLFGPCILNMLTQFISSRLETFKLQMVLQARTLPYYDPLGQDEEDSTC